MVSPNVPTPKMTEGMVAWLCKFVEAGGHVHDSPDDLGLTGKLKSLTESQ